MCTAAFVQRQHACVIAVGSHWLGLQAFAAKRVSTRTVWPAGGWLPACVERGPPRVPAGVVPCSIIYCLSRRGTQQVAAELSRQGFPAVAYHAGIKVRGCRRVLWRGRAGVRKRSSAAIGILGSATAKRSWLRVTD
jgi:hypothetical protein